MSEPREVRYRGERFTPLSHCHFYGSDGDGRQTYNDTSYPWGCVCKITNPSGGTGSGALIGPRHILTASHVLDWNTDEADKIELHLAGTVASATAASHGIRYRRLEIYRDPRRGPDLFDG